MTKYEAMLAQARKTYTTKKTALVKSGKTAAEAKTSMKAESDRHFLVASARAKCGITNKPCTIGEILAAKMRG